MPPAAVRPRFPVAALEFRFATIFAVAVAVAVVVAVTFASGGCSSTDVVGEAPPTSSQVSNAAHPAEDAPQTSPPTVSARELHRHIARLSHPDMGGRAPGTSAAPAYISAQMQEIGLSPAGDDGFLQIVPLRGTSLRAQQFDLRGRHSSRRVALGDSELVVNAMGPAGKRHTTVPVVFVGYGIDAAQAGWNDYASVDVEGALVVMLSGDPPTQDNTLDGDSLSVHGRWDTKFATAKAHGAWGCLVIHNPRTSGYPWSVIEASWGAERFALRSTSAEALTLQGFVTQAAATRIAARAGTSMDAWVTQAQRSAGASKPLELRLHASFEVVARDVDDLNVVGRLGPTSETSPSFVVTAHWDHLGERVSASGEHIVFPGAIDNATGVAGLLEIARAMANVPEPVRAHSILFAATAAEEQGLLGSRHLAQQLRPRNNAPTIGVINLESLAVAQAQPLEYVVSRDNGEALGVAFVRAIRAQGRSATPVAPDRNGAYFRADHFSFAQAGIPALTFWPAPDLSQPRGRQAAASRAARYHSTLDRYDPSWSLTGARTDCDAVLSLLTGSQ